MMNPAELTGRARSHVRRLGNPDCVLHHAVVAPFTELRSQALRAGFDIVPASSFRDFDRQLTLWNAKYRGERELLDTEGRPVTASALSPAQRVETIAIWSALPGASRHHWGTDLDLIDRNTMSEGYRVRLEQTEYAPGGVFHPMAVWLEANAAKFGFFRPFRGIESAVPPEPWHYSYALTAEPARAQLTAEILREALQSCAIEGREFVLARLDELHGRFVARIDPPPAGLPAASPKYS
jgi:LAS superfamily LD-carboxypeptidase LdcB